MDSNLLIAEKLDQIQENLETIQKLQESSSTSSQESNSILIESIQNVLNVEIKKLQDKSEKQLNENKKQITEFQSKAENQISSLKSQTTSIIADVKTDCQSYSVTAKNDIEKAAKNCCKSIKDTSIDFHNSLLPDFENLVNEIRKLRLRNLFNCLVVVVPAMLIVVAITLFGGWFYKSYGNGKMAAELARQVEKREYEEWKANQELELEAERIKLEKDLAAQKSEIESNAISEYLEGYSFSKLKKSIEENAVNDYKNSGKFREDACIEVAANIGYTNTDYYLYKYMRSTDLNKYPELKTFYDGYLKRGWKQYKEK